MKEQKISNKSFERTALRFLATSINTINDFYPGENLEERFHSAVIFNTKKMVGKLVKSYKTHPFKIYSAQTEKFDGFKDSADIIREYRVSYQFDENLLIFKLLTKTKSRFKRKCKFTLIIK
jgi:hypothetical protein